MSDTTIQRDKRFDLASGPPHIEGLFSGLTQNHRLGYHEIDIHFFAGFDKDFEVGLVQYADSRGFLGRRAAQKESEPLYLDLEIKI